MLDPLGIPHVCSSRNASLTVLEMDELKQDFIKTMDLLDDSFSSAMVAVEYLCRLGSEFSGADGRRVAQVVGGGDCGSVAAFWKSLKIP